MLDPIVQLVSFGIAWGDKKILRTIDLSIPNTGITVIFGPSGTGKSTLLRTLAGLNTQNPTIQTWGQIFYQGHLLQEHMRRPALVVQKITHMITSVRECLLSDLPQRNTLTRAEQLDVLQQHCAQLQQLWIMQVLDTSVVQLTLYQQRALAIVRETLAAPALLMLDEPTAGLDTTASTAMCELIRQAAHLQPILMVSHHLTQSKQLAQWAILIASGHVQESAPITQFFNAPQSEATQIFLRTGSCPECSSEMLDHLNHHPIPAEHQPITPAAIATLPFPAPSPKPATIAPKPLANSHFMGPRGFVWLIHGCLAGTPWPGIIRPTEEDLSLLQSVGVTHLLSLTEVPFPVALAQPFGLTVSHFPIPDMAAPTIEQAISFCIDVDQRLTAGHSIALHCKAGLGRTGTMLAVFLLWHQHGRISGEQAIAQIHALNAQMIQSELQFDLIRNFANYVAMTLVS